MDTREIIQIYNSIVTTYNSITDQYAICPGQCDSYPQCYRVLPKAPYYCIQNLDKIDLFDLVEDAGKLVQRVDESTLKIGGPLSSVLRHHSIPLYDENDNLTGSTGVAIDYDECNDPHNIGNSAVRLLVPAYKSHVAATLHGYKQQIDRLNNLSQTSGVPYAKFTYSISINSRHITDGTNPFPMSIADASQYAGTLYSAAVKKITDKLEYYKTHFNELGEQGGYYVLYESDRKTGITVQMWFSLGCLVKGGQSVFEPNHDVGYWEEVEAINRSYPIVNYSGNYSGDSVTEITELSFNDIIGDCLLINNPYSTDLDFQTFLWCSAIDECDLKIHRVYLDANYNQHARTDVTLHEEINMQKNPHGYFMKCYPDSVDLQIPACGSIIYPRGVPYNTFIEGYIACAGHENGRNELYYDGTWNNTITYPGDHLGYTVHYAPLLIKQQS